MKLLNKDIEYREAGQVMPAIVIANVSSDRVMVLNAEGDVKVIKKSTLTVLV